jgi:hypothetical protein
VTFVKALKAIDPLLLEGREILFNRQSGIHTNSNDPHLGWAILVALGDFVGGDIYLKQLNLRV